MTQIIKDFKQAAKNNEIVLIRISVSKSRMLKKFRVYYYHNNQYRPIPLEIAKELGNGVDKNGEIKIKGCGFSANDELWSNITRILEIDKLSYRFRSYVGFEEFMEYDPHMQKLIQLKNKEEL